MCEQLAKGVRIMKASSSWRLRILIAAGLSALFLSGCAGSSEYMKVIDPAQVQATASPNGALVVFERPSGFGFAVQSSVFDVTDGDPKLVGIVPAKSRIAHAATPGTHRYMVVGENAAFLDADLLEGKTYYAIVSPKFGLWKARFALEPVHGEELKSDGFKEKCSACNWIENTPASHGWANANMASIRQKQAKYLPDFLQNPDRPTLAAPDGE